MSHAKSSATAAIWGLLALAGFALARLAPPLAGLTELGQSVLGAAFAGTVLWVSEVIPLGLTAIIVLVLLGLCPGLRVPDIAGGFAGDVTLFLIGAVAIGAAVETSGLAERAARFLTRSARGDPRRLYMQLIAGFPLLALLIPSAITRNAILIPAYRDALAAMGLGKATRCGRAVMLALGMLNPLASSALLTGGITSITAATLIGGFSWLGWFALMSVPYYALLAGGAVALRLLVGRFERGEPHVDSPPARQPFSATEKRTLAVLGTHGRSLVHGRGPPSFARHSRTAGRRPAAVTGHRRDQLEDVRATIVMGAHPDRRDVAFPCDPHGEIRRSRLARQPPARPSVRPRGPPARLVVGLILAVVIVHLAITNLAACVALLLPINATIAASSGLNPVVTGLVLTITVDAVILYPVQTASNLMAYESGYFDRADVLKLGLTMLALTMVVALLTLPYWALLGFPLRAA